MAIHIGRRYCITLLGGAAAWPGASRAAAGVIGFVSGRSPSQYQ
jgi:hypothetical protein